MQIHRPTLSTLDQSAALTRPKQNMLQQNSKQLTRLGNTLVDRPSGPATERPAKFRPAKMRPNQLKFIPPRPGEIAPDLRPNKKDSLPTNSTLAALTRTPATPETPSGEERPSNCYCMEDLIASWGKSDSAYDFDSDGVVGVPDLLHLINHWEKLSQTPVQTAPEPAALVSAAGSEPEMIANNISRAADMGETQGDVVASDESATADSTDDVPNDDFMTRLGMSADTPKSVREGLNGAAARSVLGLDAPGQSAGKSVGGLRSLSDALFQHLSSSGFEDQPPTNIRELIDSLNLQPKQSDFMLKSMAEKYPDGLGVNVVG